MDNENNSKTGAGAWITFILNVLVVFPVFVMLDIFIALMILLVFFATSSFPPFWVFPFSTLIALVLLVLFVRHQFRTLIKKMPCSPRRISILWLLAAYLLGPLLLFICATKWAGGRSRDYRFQAKDYNELVTMHKETSRMAEQLIPEGATEIDYFEHSPFFFGGYAHVKCTCTKDELMSFAAKRGYEFTENGYMNNANPEGPQGVNSISMTWGFFHSDPYQLTPHDYPKNNLGYSYIFPNHGGKAFLYDVDNQILYARWTHN